MWLKHCMKEMGSHSQRAPRIAKQTPEYCRKYIVKT